MPFRLLSRQIQGSAAAFLCSVNSNLDDVNTEIQSLSSNWVNNECENNKWIFDLTNKTPFRQGILIICSQQNNGVYVGKAYIDGTDTVDYIGIADDGLVSVSYSNSILTVILNYNAAWATCTIIGL